MHDALLWIWMVAFVVFAGYVIVGLIEKRRPPAWAYLVLPALYGLSALIEVAR